MILLGQLIVSLFDVLQGSVSRDAQNAVVVLSLEAVGQVELAGGKLIDGILNG